MSQQGAVMIPSNGQKAAQAVVKVAQSQPPDPEVVPKAKRRTFTAAYKLRILSQVDRCTKPGQIGALLRSEGLYSSYLTTWRRQRANGELGSKKRGRPADPSAKELARLKAENVRLAARLEKAEAIIEVQKKLSDLLGLTSAAPHKGDSK